MCLCDRENFLQTGFLAQYFCCGRLWAKSLKPFVVTQLNYFNILQN